MKYLNDEEINELSLKYKRNPEKRDFFKQYYNKMFIKNMDFDEYWNRAMKVARKEQFFGKYIDEYRNLTKETIHILREKILYEENLFDIAETITGYKLHKGKEIHMHEVRVYRLRTKSFFEKYGEDICEYDFGRKLKTNPTKLKDYLDLYSKEIITRDELNNVIKFFQDNNPDYPNSSFYKGKYNNNGDERDYR